MDEGYLKIQVSFFFLFAEITASFMEEDSIFF